MVISSGWNFYGNCSYYYGWDSLVGSYGYEDPESALLRQAQIILNLPVTLRSCERAMARNGRVCKFEYEDRIWEGFLPEGCTVEALELNEIPKPRCVSCGKEGFCFSHDALGRCENTVNAFWEKVRKVYWHRHSKNKNVAI